MKGSKHLVIYTAKLVESLVQILGRAVGRSVETCIYIFKQNNVTLGVELESKLYLY